MVQPLKHLDFSESLDFLFFAHVGDVYFFQCVHLVSAFVTHLVNHTVLALANFANDSIVPQLILLLRYHNKLKMDAFKSKPSLSDQLKSKHSLEKEQVR